MSDGVEAPFTSALGLQLPWVVEDVKLDTVNRRIDFEIGCHGSALACPACGAAAQPVHDRLRRSWRHLDFFQFEAWLHCDVPRIACSGCGKTTQMLMPWARPGSGFTAAFEALVMALFRQFPVRQAAGLLRCADKQLWRRIEHYVEQARALKNFAGVQLIGIDETSLRRNQNYITVVHDMDAKRLLFSTQGREHQIGDRLRRRPQGPGRRSGSGAACVHGHERSLCQGRGSGAAAGADQLRRLSCRGNGHGGDGSGSARGDGARRLRRARGSGSGRPHDTQAADVGHAAQPAWLESAGRSRRCTGCSIQRSTARGPGG